MNKDTKKYLRAVRFSFPVFRKTEKRFWNDLRLSLGDYEALHPDCNFDDLSRKFGTPGEVVIDYFNNLDSQKYIAAMRRSFYIKIITIVALVFITVSFLFQAYLLMDARTQFRESIIKYEDITITQD